VFAELRDKSEYGMENTYRITCLNHTGCWLAGQAWHCYQHGRSGYCACVVSPIQSLAKNMLKWWLFRLLLQPC